MCQITIDNMCYTTVTCQCLHKLVNKITYKKDKKSIDFGPKMAYNIDSSRDNNKQTRKGDNDYEEQQGLGFQLLWRVCGAYR